jgi:cystathionine beta-lyase
LHFDGAGSASVKWDGRRRLLRHGPTYCRCGSPTWTSPRPEPVTRALRARAEHPVYGYTLFPDSVYDALIGWLQPATAGMSNGTGYSWSPGVVPSLHATVHAFTQPGEGVIVQPPVYYPVLLGGHHPGRRLDREPAAGE